MSRNDSSDCITDYGNFTTEGTVLAENGGAFSGTVTDKNSFLTHCFNGAKYFQFILTQRNQNIISTYQWTHDWDDGHWEDDLKSVANNQITYRGTMAPHDTNGDTHIDIFNVYKNALIINKVTPDCTHITISWLRNQFGEIDSYPHMDIYLPALQPAGATPINVTHPASPSGTLYCTGSQCNEFKIQAEKENSIYNEYMQTIANKTICPLLTSSKNLDLGN